MPPDAPARPTDTGTDGAAPTVPVDGGSGAQSRTDAAPEGAAVGTASDTEPGTGPDGSAAEGSGPATGRGAGARSGQRSATGAKGRGKGGTRSTGSRTGRGRKKDGPSGAAAPAAPQAPKEEAPVAETAAAPAAPDGGTPLPADQAPEQEAPTTDPAPEPEPAHAPEAETEPDPASEPESAHEPEPEPEPVATADGADGAGEAVDADRTVESVDADPAEPAADVEPVEPAAGVEPVEPADATEPTAPDEAAKPAADAEPAAPPRPIGQLAFRPKPAGRPGAAAGPARDDVVGRAGGLPDEIGGYRVLAPLGHGGMGAVYRALDADGRTVALKLLHAHLDDPEARERLTREVAALQKIRHTGVARVLDAEIDSTEAFVVTELVSGRDLGKHVKRFGALPPEQLVELATRLRAALEVVHAAGVLHRDLTPGNVMVTAEGPVLIDFGLAQSVEDARVDAVGLVTGTPGYVSPELLDGAPPTEASDWWGWAAVLTFAATGRPPFGKGTIGTVLTRVRAGEPDLEDLPESLAEALRGALAVDPAERTSPDQLLAVLEEHAATTAGEPAADDGADVTDDARETAEDPGDEDATPTVVVVAPGAGADAVTTVLVDTESAHDGETTVLPTSTPEPVETDEGAEASAAGRPVPSVPDAETEVAQELDVVEVGEAPEDRAQPEGHGASVVAADDADAPVDTVVGADRHAEAEVAHETDAGAGYDTAYDTEDEAGYDTAYDTEDEVGYDAGYDTGDQAEYYPEPAPRRTITVLALALPFLALGLARPGAAFVAALVVAALLRSVELDAEAVERRQARRGVRASDRLVAVLTWPWYLVRGALGVVPLVVVGGAVVVLIGGITWWLIEAGHWTIAPLVPGQGSGLLRGNLPWVGRAWVGAMAALGLGMIWFGPMARTHRDGARRVLARVAPPPWGVLAAVVLGVAVAAVVATAMLGQDVVWWPLGGRPRLG